MTIRRALLLPQIQQIFEVTSYEELFLKHPEFKDKARLRSIAPVVRPHNGTTITYDDAVMEIKESHRVKFLSYASR